MKLDSRYAACFPEYSYYFRRALRLLNCMYGMANSGKLFTDNLIEWLIEEFFIQSQCNMSIYYNYAPDGKKLLFYIMLMDIYIGLLMKLLENGFRKIFHVNLLGYAHLFMSIRISHMKDHSIYVYQA